VALVGIAGAGASVFVCAEAGCMVAGEDVSITGSGAGGRVAALVDGAGAGATGDEWSIVETG
jgi:hypothetical protein